MANFNLNNQWSSGSQQKIPGANQVFNPAAVDFPKIGGVDSK
jgi:hypothetical protein